MKSQIIILVIATLLVCAQASCTASVTLTARQGGSWVSNGVTFQIYDISAVNTGSDSITSLRATFNFSPLSSITESWNYDRSTNLFTNYGGRIFPNQNFNGAGFVFSGNGPVVVGSIVAVCGTSPTSPPTNPPTTPPTQKPTTPPTQKPTTPPTNTPTNPPTNPPSQNCSASFTLTRRAGGAFLENGIPSQIWDLLFRNTGLRPITDIKLTITPAANSAVNQNNKWNLVYDAATNWYTAQLFNALYLPQSTYTGSGFVIAGNTTLSPSVALVRVTC